MNKELKNYNSIDNFVEDEIVINKSRFIGRAYPIKSKEEADEIIAQVRKEHYKSTHVCSAWILATEPLLMKSSDDGEPSGTAGKPILSVLEKQNLKNILVLVIRYFGGIKLGANGLVRAYSESASNVIKKANKVKIEENDIIQVETEYSFYQGLLLHLKKFNVIPEKEEFEDIVKLTFSIPIEHTSKLIKIIEDFTNDNFLAEVIDRRLVSKDITEEEIKL